VTETHRPAEPEERPSYPIGPLLKLAGRRSVPDPSYMAAARVAAREEWARVVKRRAWRISLWKVSAAALIFVASGTAIWFARRQSPASVSVPSAAIATLQIVTGSVIVTSSEFSERVVAHAGMRLIRGARVETTEGGRAAFSVGSNGSIRLDRSTVVVLDGAERLRLDQGAVYVDTGTGSHESALRVQTALGIVDHLGTQFEVRLDDRTLRVSVREGSVAVEHRGTRSTSHAGQRLIFAADRPVERQTIETFAADWSWTTGLASRFDLEGATVPRFLDWASRELGMTWAYGEPAMRRRVDRIVLHGSIEGLTPDEALAAVLPTCGLTFYRERGRMIITAQAK
jgi:hypothetical protein